MKKQKPAEKPDPADLSDMVITFVKATGLRPTELELLCECNVAYQSYDDRVYVYIEDEDEIYTEPEGHRFETRTVPVLKDHEDEILHIVDSVAKGEYDLLFPDVPPDLPYEEARRHYARELYEELRKFGHNQESALAWVMEVLAETNMALIKQYCLQPLPPQDA